MTDPGQKEKDKRQGEQQANKREEPHNTAGTKAATEQNKEKQEKTTRKRRKEKEKGTKPEKKAREGKPGISHPEPMHGHHPYSHRLRYDP